MHSRAAHLRELGLPVGAQVLVTEAARDLRCVNGGSHSKGLEGARQCSRRR